MALVDPRIPLHGGCIRANHFIAALASAFDVDVVYMQAKGRGEGGKPTGPIGQYLPGIRSSTAVPFNELQYFVFSRPLLAAARKCLEAQRYDYIFCDYGTAALYGWLLSRRFQVPFIYASHNIEHLMNIDKAKSDFRRIPFIPYMYWVERLGARRSTFLVAISQDEARYFTRWKASSDILLIPQGFDAAVFNPFYDPPVNDEPIILFCGNFSNQFNLEGLRAFARDGLQRALQLHPKARFRFIGSNPPADIRHPRVEFTGFVDDYVSHLKCADVVISPMLDGHGFPTKIVEALACGKQVLSTEVGARGVERDYASLQIAELEQFPEKLTEILARNRPVVADDFATIKDRYSWDGILRKLIGRISATSAH